MTSTETLIDDQRAALLELGFRQRHGFLYVFVRGNLRIEATIQTGGAWVVRASLMAPGAFHDDEFRISPGMSLRAFRQVVGGLVA